MPTEETAVITAAEDTFMSPRSEAGNEMAQNEKVLHDIFNVIDSYVSIDLNPDNEKLGFIWNTLMRLHNVLQHRSNELKQPRSETSSPHLGNILNGLISYTITYEAEKNDKCEQLAYEFRSGTEVFRRRFDTEGKMIFSHELKPNPFYT